MCNRLLGGHVNMILPLFFLGFLFMMGYTTCLVTFINIYLKELFMEQLPNMRLTAQRQVILEELSKVTSHPTANEVYDMVRRRLPRIGLGTVYRNLELMADVGVILKLEVGGTQKRFDATVEPHYHVRCTSCGKVNDIEIAVQEQDQRDGRESKQLQNPWPSHRIFRDLSELSGRKSEDGYQLAPFQGGTDAA